MPDRPHFPLAVITFVVMTISLSFPAAAKWTGTARPRRRVNGSPVLFRVTAPNSVRALSATWLGHDISFNFDATHKMWFALAGVGLETKPGIYPLLLHSDSDSTTPPSFEKKISVEHQRYPPVLLKVH